MPFNITQAEPLENLISSTLGTNEGPLIADRIVDITDICDRDILAFEQVVINYFSRSTDAATALIEFRFTEGKQSANSSRFGVSTEVELPEQLAAEPGFQMRARLCGCEPLLLAQTMVEFLPTDNPLAA